MNIILFHWNNVMNDVEPELIRRGHKVKSFSKYPMSKEVFDEVKKSYGWADKAIFWNEIDKYGWTEDIKEAKKANCKTILYQLGRRGTSRIFPPFNELPMCDTLLVWGEADKKRLVSVGVEENRIKVVGTPIFKRMKPREKHEGKNIVFSLEHWCEPVIENYMVASQLRKLDYGIITKGLAEMQDTDMFDNVVLSDRREPSHLDLIANILAKTDLVVGISESTFELLAQHLDIPVVIADIWQPKSCDNDDRYKKYKRIYSDACLMEKDIFKLGDTIKWHLKHPEYLRKEREKIAIEDGGVNIKDPIKAISDAIENA